MRKPRTENRYCTNCRRTREVEPETLGGGRKGFRCKKCGAILYPHPSPKTPTRKNADTD